MRNGFLNHNEEVEFMTRKYKDCVVQTRVNGMTLANAIIWLEHTYGKVYNMSQALRGALEILEQTAINEGLEVYTSPEHAEAFLNKLGVQLRTNKAGGYSHMRALQQDSIKKDRAGTTMKFNDGLPETEEEFKQQFKLGLLSLGVNLNEEELTDKCKFGWSKICEQRKGSLKLESEPKEFKGMQIKLQPSDEFNWNDTDKMLKNLDIPQVITKEENSNE
jgi:hypothetical protein